MIDYENNKIICEAQNRGGFKLTSRASTATESFCNLKVSSLSLNLAQIKLIVHYLFS